MSGYGILIILGAVVFVIGAVSSVFIDLFAVIPIILGLSMLLVGGIGKLHMTEHHFDAEVNKVQQQATEEENQSIQRYQLLVDQFQQKEHVKVQGVYDGADETNEIWNAGKYAVLGTNGKEYDVFVDDYGVIQRVIAVKGD